DGGGWHNGVRFGANIEFSGPSLIQSSYGMQGNLELVAVLNTGQVQHWWRDDHGDGNWHMSATFGHDVQAVAALVEGSFGFNLEVIVLRTDRKLQHYWRDGGGWHEGPIIGSAA